MILRFPYMDELLPGPPPPSLPQSARERWRPIVPITIHGPFGNTAVVYRALLDSGADDTIIPIHIANKMSIPLFATTGHAMRWRGQPFGLQFGAVDLELTDGAGQTIRWTATVAFTTAQIRYPILGICGCLEFLDAKLLGSSRMIELEPNASCPLIS